MYTQYLSRYSTLVAKCSGLIGQIDLFGSKKIELGLKKIMQIPKSPKKIFLTHKILAWILHVQAFKSYKIILHVLHVNVLAIKEVSNLKSVFVVSQFILGLQDFYSQTLEG